MKRKMPVVECDLCGFQQVDNGDPTEIYGLTINRAFYADKAGGGPVPKDTFICLGCIYGDGIHGPIQMSILVPLVFGNEVTFEDFKAFSSPPENKKE